MIDVPRSKEFDDVYFSVSDGLAETRHIFLNGNNLPESWMEKERFTICETGFGTGLNFLAVLQLLQQNEKPKALHYISFEKFPLNRTYIQHSLSRWDELKSLLDFFLSIYPSEINKNIYNLSIFDDIELTLIFGDVNDALPKLQKSVDCWFLDGFKPRSNPDMWSNVVFQNMARLSHMETTFATFTSAGFVRRGLQAVGFDVQKVKGFGRKREMCIGKYVGKRCE